MTTVSKDPTPYAVDCTNCGLVYMTEEFYSEQMMCPDSKWICPICGRISSWNDDNYESYLD